MSSEKTQQYILALRLYESLYRIRWTENKIASLYPSDVIKSPVHLSIGQESVSVGVCDALKKTDIVFGTYRGHALYLAKGGNLKAMIAELFGKIDGCAKGKGGSMHLVDSSAGVMGTSAVVATSISEAVGYALAINYQEKNEIVVCFFGDGATGAGAFHESLNFAALKKLPILFVCENNEYAIHSHLSDRSSQKDLYKFGLVNNIPSYVQKDKCIFKLRSRCEELINEIRLKKGPRFIEVYTDRWLEHVGPNEDWHLGYRSEEEKARWLEEDQIKIVGEMLKISDRKDIEQKIKKELKEAIKFAEKSAFPGETELYKDVYK